MFFYKHIKFRNQIRFYLAIYDFDARIMLSLCLTFQGSGLKVREKFNSNVVAKSEFFISDFFRFINLVKGENIVLVQGPLWPWLVS